MRDTVFILCRRKARGNSSYHLMSQLKERGINVYRVTADRTPRRAPERAYAVVNYGVSATPVWVDRLHESVDWYNTTETIRLSANKARMTDHMVGARIPQLEHTPSRLVAQEWIDQDDVVISRTKLTGCRGQGIVLSPPDPLPECRLYTKLFTGPKVREYRVYVVNRFPIDLTEKKRWSNARCEAAGIDKSDIYKKLVRTNGNGWVFARHNLRTREEDRYRLCVLTRACANAFDMGLGCVDLIASFDSDNRMLDARVIETNTSISLVGDRNTRQVVADVLARVLEPLGN